MRFSGQIVLTTGNYPVQENSTVAVLRRRCSKLGVSSLGFMCLVSCDDVVPARSDLSAWPGIRACGERSEYQPVIEQS
eukprot:5982942-Amphidinium_carterae.1